MAPYLFWLLAQRRWNAALAIILVAGITDALDGFFARRWGASSRVGEVLDPIADKILLSGAFLTLALTGSIAVWLAALVLGRDALLLLAAAATLALSKKPRRFPPSIWGKLSTIVQVSYVVAVVAQVPVPLMETAKWSAAVLTLWSGVDYAWRYTRT